MRLSSTSSSLRRLSLLLFGIMPVCLLLLATTGPASAHVAAGEPNFSLAPVLYDPANALTRAYFIFYGRAGEQGANSVRVTNVGTGRGTLNLYAVDAVTGQSSGTTFLNRTDARHDVGAWITLSRSQVTLDPGSSEVVPFRLTIPHRVRPGQHAGGIIAEMATQPIASSANTAGIGLQHRIALGVLVNLPGPTLQRLTATEVRYDQASSYQRLLIALHNTGTQLLHPHGTFQIRNIRGQEQHTYSLTLDTFIPQTSIEYPLYIQHHPLAAGTYQATLRLLYEQKHILLYTTTFVILPPDVIHPTKTFSGVINALATTSFDMFLPAYYIIGFLLLLLIGGGISFWSTHVYRLAKKSSTKSTGRSIKQ